MKYDGRAKQPEIGLSRSEHVTGVWTCPRHVAAAASRRALSPSLLAKRSGPLQRCLLSPGKRAALEKVEGPRAVAGHGRPPRPSAAEPSVSGQTLPAAASLLNFDSSLFFPPVMWQTSPRMSLGHGLCCHRRKGGGRGGGTLVSAHNIFSQFLRLFDVKKETTILCSHVS